MSGPILAVIMLVVVAIVILGIWENSKNGGGK